MVFLIAKTIQWVPNGKNELYSCGSNPCLSIRSARDTYPFMSE